MTLKPCIGCGTPTRGSRCDDCKPKDTRTDRTHVAWRNDTRWKNLSKRLRKASPFCEWCGTDDQLSVDHILPDADYPQLAYAVENCRVLCKRCNGKRGNNFTDAEAQHVIDRLADTYRRRPTADGRARLDAARTALTRGDAPPRPPRRPAGKARGAMNLTGVEFR